MTIVILAAGLGSRYGGTKQLDIVGDNGETIIDFSIYDAIQAGFKKLVLVVREEILEEVKEHFYSKLLNKIEVVFVCQKLNDIPLKYQKNNRLKPWGTAHALLSAKNEVNENFCVINADDFYGKDSFFKIINFLKQVPKDTCSFAMIGYQIENTLSENGTVSRGECIIDNQYYLNQVHERTSIYKENNTIVYLKEGTKIEIEKNTMVSMNFWGFTPQIFNETALLFDQFLKENYLSEKQEFYLPSVVNNLLKNKKASVKVVETTSKWMGVTYKEDKENVILKIKELKEKGIYPQKLWN